MPDWNGWAGICLEAALLALCSVAIYEGARRLLAGRASRWTPLMLAVALFAPGYEGLASLRQATLLSVLARQPASMQAAEPPGGWEKAAMTPEERTRGSTTAAQLNFRLAGKRGQVIDAQGQRVPFQPDDLDLADRDHLVLGQKGVEDKADQFQERGYRMISSAAVFLVLGGIVGLRQRKRPASGR